ncbi:polyketide cyclase [Saccharomonospora azurea]|uniref:SnoaL-like polyketide cyclase n=1 Tax=Saccharomonospora azurea NA-128 TaxID=882081 RepID=H8GA12_9PSEU|nr:hypothetical protein [Saccharomonospora azurea]EHK87881.1 hypothetical protein SZMC14600_08153 [Saccharomonospora azurea SZMC 14600]EHY88539.1 SnoaL-like polyketide cyclase [Saccharomonospora azurea NA-128]
MTGMQLLKWENDRIVEEWGSFDLFGRLRQRGVLPERAEQRR